MAVRFSRRRSFTRSTSGYPRGMYERALEQAADDLGRRRRRAIHTGVLGVAAASAALATVWFSIPLAAALAAGAFLEALLAAAALDARRQLVARLALQPAAYALPEVAAFGARAARPPQRARLAAWLAEVVAEAGTPFSLCLGDRVALVAHELEALACELVSPARSMEPASAVACRRLLTHMTESPLYNPGIPVGDLHAALHRIRAGIA
jgi:hypothetical protein